MVAGFFCSSMQLRFAILGGVELSDLAEIEAGSAGDIDVRNLSDFMPKIDDLKSD